MRERERELQTHYDIQMDRRSRDIEDWNQNRKVMAYSRHLQMTFSELRNASYGTLVGVRGQVPSRVINTRIMDVAPGQRTSTHRHVHSAELFVVEGEGYTVVNNRKFSWSKWDAIYLPTNSWHYSVNTGTSTARFVSISDAPLFSLLNMNRIEDIGRSEPPGPFCPDNNMQRLA
ncbi:MAG: cupin domain-containing protein, partial [Candidatus Binatia bacterium]|nr:cupin domain-containing protein [Candidatus Binatia bacterium]